MIPSITSQQMREDADFNQNIRLNTINELFSIAQGLAPAFRDKFDFSTPKHYEDWAEMSWKGAVALLDRKLLEMEVVCKDHAKAIEKADIQALKEPVPSGKPVKKEAAK